MHGILHQRLRFDQVQVALQQVAKAPLLHHLPLLQLHALVMFKDGQGGVPGPHQMGGDGQVEPFQKCIFTSVKEPGPFKVPVKL